MIYIGQAPAKPDSQKSETPQTVMVMGGPVEPGKLGQLINANRGYLAEIRAISVTAGGGGGEFMNNLRREGSGRGV